MTETEEILYREGPSNDFEKYVYIGTAYPEDMYQSPPSLYSRDDLKELVEDENLAEILVNLAFNLIVYYQSPEEFEDLFSEELNSFYDEYGSEIESVIDKWLLSVEVPVFSGLDLKEQRIKESDFFTNGELRNIKFTDGSEVKILNENSGYGGGYYVVESKYSQLLEDIEDLRKIFSGPALY